MSVQRIVEDTPPLQIEAEMQHLTGNIETPTRHLIKFEQIYLSKPTHWENDGSPVPMMPNETRLRNLTYSSPLYVDITKTMIKDGEEPTGFFLSFFLHLVHIKQLNFIFFFLLTALKQSRSILNCSLAKFQ